MKKKIMVFSIVGMLFAGAVYAAVQGQAEETTLQIQQDEQSAEQIPQTEIVANFEIPQADAAYLSGLIEQGYRADWLEEIYDFWLTCGEDISIIEDIYQISEQKNFTGRYWVEESYNAVTNNVHGVLNIEQVGSYLGKSITREQINQANILSRQGVYTITEILDKLLEGKSWSELVNDVYGAGTVPADAVHLNMEGLAKIEKISELEPISSVIGDYYEFKEVTASESMYGESQVIHSMYGDGAATVVCMPKKQVGEVELPQANEITEETKTLEDVLNAGVSQEELETLGKKYSAEKIYLAQEIGQDNEKSASEVLEEYERDGSWSKLLKEAE